MKIFLLTVSVFFSCCITAQPVAVLLADGMNKMEKDPQFAHASIGLYVVNSQTGELIFDKNSWLGLAPASTQKVITSVSAYEILGKDFTYRSELVYEGKIEKGLLRGRLIFKGSGDPTLGSWRWKQTNQASFKKTLLDAFATHKINTVQGDLLIDASIFESQATPNGWTWEDIGNYYGAGIRGANWHENQYDLMLRPGKAAGDPVGIIPAEPAPLNTSFVNELKTGAPGSGDNSIIYLPENGTNAFLRGTVPAGVSQFKISGAVPNSPAQLAAAITENLSSAGISIAGKSSATLAATKAGGDNQSSFTNLANFLSPAFDSMNYWFLKESINLYGEAFLKTIAYKQKRSGTSKDGIDIIQTFWQSKGIDKSELNIKDGSGLSPANRVTPHALVNILQYASKQDWFASFYQALPLQNGIKMKSGYIGGVRSYTGYVKSKTGAQYTFAFIINNFDGSPAAVKEKMWKLLDLLK